MVLFHTLIEVQSYCIGLHITIIMLSVWIKFKGCRIIICTVGASLYRRMSCGLQNHWLGEFMLCDGTQKLAESSEIV